MKLDVDDTTILHISWENIKSGAESIALHILRHEKPDVVFAQQTDIITASLVCNIVEVPLCIVHLNNIYNGTILDCIPKVCNPIISGTYTQPPLPTIAVVSTLIDNQRNVNELISHYRKRGHVVKPLSVYSRKNIDNPPEYSWIKLTQSTRVVFPWQNQDTII